MSKNIFFAISTILMVLLVSCGKGQSGLNQSQQIRTYHIDTLSVSDVELRSEFPAVIKGIEDVDIKPRVEGFIESVFVDEGTIVKKGQPLFKINSPASVQAIENAQAVYNTAKTDVERMRPLAEKGIISNVRLRTYENTMTSAKAALDQAKATIGWTTVTSPVDGIVGTLSYRIGSLVNSSSVLTTVANTKKVVAYFSINEKELLQFMREWKGNTQAEKIKNMPQVKLQLADGSTYEESGKIETISGVVDAVSGSVTIRALFSNNQGLLRSGTSGKITIPKYIENILVIPQKATANQQDKILVYKVEGDSVVQKIITVKSTPNGKDYAVFAGINAGDVIVTDGLATLRHGQKIKF